MQEAVGCLIVLVVGLAILVGVGTVGFLFATSKAVLYYEEQLQPGMFGCHYFTGTRTLTQFSYFETGCVRFIEVGR